METWLNFNITDPLIPEHDCIDLIRVRLITHKILQEYLSFQDFQREMVFTVLSLFSHLYLWICLEKPEYSPVTHLQIVTHPFYFSANRSCFSLHFGLSVTFEFILFDIYSFYLFSVLLRALKSLSLCL